MLTQLMLPQLAQATLETGLNQLVQRSPEAKAVLAKLKGKVLALKLQQHQYQLYLAFSAQHIDLLSQYEDRPDCAVAIDRKLLWSRPQKAALSQYINDKSLIFNGDLTLLQDFASLLERLETDPAQWLAPYLGDVLAFSAVSVCQKLTRQVSQRLALSQRFWGERLTEEWQLVSPRLALADFNDEVKKLEKQTALLEQKIAQLSYENHAN